MLNHKEHKIIATLAGIFSLRMLGLFMILPVFAINASKLNNSTPKLIGISIGIYGLTQSLLQIPFGMLSDYFGRKKIILIGLLLLIAGSLVCAFSQDIWSIIIGRALQGAGAIGCVIMATIADFTNESRRTRAMGIVGLSIGVSFVLSLVIGPIINQGIGLRGIFIFSALLGLIGIILLKFIPASSEQSDTLPTIKQILPQIYICLTNNNLFKLSYGIFALHASLSAIFLGVPFYLQQSGMPNNKLWLLYLGVMLSSLIIAGLFIRYREKKIMHGTLQVGAIFGLLISEILMFFAKNYLPGIIISLICFFTAFCILEASLPSLVSINADKQRRGTALGIFSSSQFLGIFIGGAVGGYLQELFGLPAVFNFCILITASWLCLISLTKQTNLLNLKNLNNRRNKYV